MIRLCPFCGIKLSRMLSDGITTCDNCNRIFDSSIYHRILSAAWMVRRWHVWDVATLQKVGISEEDANMVYKYVAEEMLTHEEFMNMLNDIDYRVAV
jgi:hypothetical protein